ncbi:MAG: PQQ-binding-like beta-propeller repeat protein [Verrucomicrobiota bacterium]
MDRYQSSCIPVVLLLALASCGDGDLTHNTIEQSESNFEAKWNPFRGNKQLQGVVNVSVPGVELTWEYDTGAPVKSSPVIAKDKVFIGNDAGKFVALSLSTGSVIWERELVSNVEGGGAVVGDVIFVGNQAGEFYALDMDSGKTLWIYETEGEIKSSPNVAQLNDKTLVLIGSYDGSIYCFDSEERNLFWKFETGDRVNGTPAVTEKNEVLLGGCDTNIYVIDLATGKQIRLIEAGSYIAGSMAVRGGFGYVGHYGEEVLAVDIRSGLEKWRFKRNDFPYFSSPAVTEEYLIIGCRDKFVYCLDRNTGELWWDFATRGDVDSSPVIAGDVVLVASNDGRFYGVTYEDGELVWQYDIGSRLSSSPAVVPGWVVIGAGDGTVCGFSIKN